MSRPERCRRKLPLGIQNLRDIREAGHDDADKSLLVDTSKALFEGNRVLFTRLAAESRRD
ncbi:putative metal-dependent HD superfamily phosphohydrolase [Sphaerotilus sulfidivorans]|uniref:Metal-dependent HD superfamily phosphohydrolase n=1 Tax=Sphaerotilus sulfidivorans TaxID=639200 RepID=A0ABV2IS72_9BURK|nr:hypothetical protein [Sphaerotilus sulfidivorans]